MLLDYFRILFIIYIIITLLCKNAQGIITKLSYFFLFNLNSTKFTFLKKHN